MLGLTGKRITLERTGWHARMMTTNRHF